MYKNSGNKNAILSKLAEKDPRISMLANRGNLKDVFYDECSKRGVDPQTILSALNK